MARITRLYSDIDLNFNAHPASADVTKKIDINAIKQSLTTILKTRQYERHFVPEFGAGLNALLFEPIDYITTNLIKQKIRLAIANFEPRVGLLNLDVIPQEEENRYEITLTFTVVGLPDPIVYTTFLKRLR